MQKLFILIGIVFIVIGIIFPWLWRLNIGQLPGDVFIKKENFSFYFPITTSMIVSIILSLLFWLLRK